jgi:sugar-specific transcriptional regulator TrmB
MPELKQMVSTIQELGFSSNEAKTYISLLRNNPVTRYELSKNSGVPRSAIYGVIKKLENLGAVNALYSEPEQYIPLPPEQLLKQLQDRFASRVKSAQDVLKGVESSLEEDHLWNIVGYQNMIHKAKEIIKGAKSSLYLSIWERELQLLKPELRSAVKRGIMIIIFSFTPVRFDPAYVFSYRLDEKQLEEFWVHKLIMVADTSELLMGEADDKIPKKTAWTSNRAIVDIAKNHIILDITLYGLRFNKDVSQVVTGMQRGESKMLGKLLSKAYPEMPNLHTDIG